MTHEDPEANQIPESDLTARRRWVPLRGMEGSRRERTGLCAAARSAAAPPARGQRPGVPLEWLIVGGGVHGTYLSHFVTRALGFDSRAVRVLDPYDRPLATWRRNAENVGMEYLRSAAVHHLDLASLSLKRFAAERAEAERLRGRPAFLPPYGRPLLELFNRHTEEVVGRSRLAEMRLQGRACGLRPTAEGYEVDYRSRTGLRSIAARRVLLAIGMDDAVSRPPWAVELEAARIRVHHVLDPHFRRSELAPWKRAIVYGGGLSGEQVSAALSARAPGTVTLLSGHEIGVHLFDSEPSWQGGRFMSAFASESDPEKRRAIIARERHRGSVTPEGQEEMNRLRSDGALQFAVVDPTRIVASRTARGSFRLDMGERRFDGDLLILSTGYDAVRPGGEWLDRAVEEMGLPCAPCGYPIVTPALEWREGLFVSGPLAELELGPVARNISGAHRAAARLEYYLSEDALRAS